MWPEDTRPEAVEACPTADHGTTKEWRADPQLTALAFADRRLGWPKASVIEQSADRYGHTLTISRDGHARVDGRYQVSVFVVEALPGCWSLFNVNPTRPGRDRSMQILDGEVLSVGFNPLGAASAKVEVGYGTRTKSFVWPERSRTLDFGSTPNASGHFLVILFDERGNAFSARGGALPAGDFAAA